MNRFRLLGYIIMKFYPLLLSNVLWGQTGILIASTLKKKFSNLSRSFQEISRILKEFPTELEMTSQVCILLCLAYVHAYPQFGFPRKWATHHIFYRNTKNKVSPIILNIFLNLLTNCNLIVMITSIPKISTVELGNKELFGRHRIVP